MSENFEKEEYYIKISGKANIPERLNLSENYEILAKGTITKEESEDANNGTKLITARFEPITIDIISSLGKKIKAKDTRKESQKLRSKLFMVHQETPDLIVDFDIWYAKVMQLIRLNAEEIIKQYYPNEK